MSDITYPLHGEFKTPNNSTSTMTEAIGDDAQPFDYIFWDIPQKPMGKHFNTILSLRAVNHRESHTSIIATANVFHTHI